MLSKVLSLVFVATILTPTVHAEILFEGFYRIEEKKKHIGYVVQRYELDSKTQHRTMTTYFHRKEGEDVLETMIKTVAVDTAGPKGTTLFVPLSVNHNSNESGVQTLTKSTFVSPTKAKVEIFHEDAKTPSQTIEREGDEGSFQSNFLFYILAETHKGDLLNTPVNKDLPYEGFSEDDGSYSYGSVRRVADKTTSGHRVIQFHDYFMGETLENFILPNGDMIGVRNGDTIVHLVQDRAEAVGLFDLPKNKLVEFFGDLPDGKKNRVSSANVNTYSIIKSFKEAKEERRPNNSEPTAADVVVKLPVKSK